MRQQLLDARDTRQALIDRACGPGGESLRPARGRVVFVSTSVPGPEKNPAGLAPLFAAACERLASRLGTSPDARGVDALGPWALFRTPLPAAIAKRITVELEEAQPAGRLLDSMSTTRGGRWTVRPSVCRRVPASCATSPPSSASGCSGTARPSWGEWSRRSWTRQGRPSAFATLRMYHILASLRRDMPPAGHRQAGGMPGHRRAGRTRADTQAGAGRSPRQRFPRGPVVRADDTVNRPAAAVLR